MDFAVPLKCTSYHDMAKYVSEEWNFELKSEIVLILSLNLFKIFIWSRISIYFDLATTERLSDQEFRPLTLF